MCDLLVPRGSRHCVVAATCLCAAWRRTIPTGSDGGACHHAAQHRRGPERPRGNFSLCHGLAGNSESLLYAYETLGPDFGDLRTASLVVAQAGLDRFASTGAPWPCGTQSMESPGLMLGLAGIGHFYLRLHDPPIRSILILHEEGTGGGAGRSRAG